jgi:hypothetical protein
LDKSSVVSTSSGSVSATSDGGSELATEQPTVETVKAVEVVSDSDDSSDSDSDSDSEVDSDDDSDSDDDDEAELEKLLQAAKLSAAKASTKTNEENTLGGDGDVVSFGEDDEEKQRRREA